MSVLKYTDPETGEVKKVGMPQVDAYGKAEVDQLIGNHSHAPSDSGLTTENWTFTLEDGSTVTKAVYVG